MLSTTDKTFLDWYEDAVEAWPPEGSDRHYRWGQHLFNHLSACDSALANSVPADKDPFYDDANVPHFLSWVMWSWPEVYDMGGQR